MRKAIPVGALACWLADAWAAAVASFRGKGRPVEDNGFNYGR
jgi:hypothetical protein